jgi:hypothetical protein
MLFTKHQEVNFITKKKTNWEEYRMKLQEVNLYVRLKSPMEIDSALTSLINIIKQATQEMFQLKLKKS